MLRTLGTVFGVMAVATLITQGIVFAFYWNQGTLNPQSIQDIKMIMQGLDPSENDLLEEEEHKETQTPSHEDVSIQRAIRVVGIHEQNNIFSTIGENLRKEAKRIEEEKENLEQSRTKFQEELQGVIERNTSAEVERARGVIQSLKPDAQKVDHLMTLDLIDCVILLKEMDNKEISKILRQFADSDQVEVEERGKQIFQNIYRGEPLNSLAKAAMDDTRIE
ncbi:MAG: hypothetical protein KDA65_11535 [Planctomycetaceae bacterium]|nr:hypothetical protein [Planctomycetaceae bacterium]